MQCPMQRTGAISQLLSVLFSVSDPKKRRHGFRIFLRAPDQPEGPIHLQSFFPLFGPSMASRERCESIWLWGLLGSGSGEVP